MALDIFTNTNSSQGYSWNPTIWQRSADLSLSAYKTALQFLRDVIIKQSENVEDNWLTTSPGRSAISQCYIAIDAIKNAGNDASRREAWANFMRAIDTIIQGQESELQFARSTPEYQFMQLMATGMSPDAARAALTGSQPGMSITPDAAVSQAPDVGSQLLSGLGTAASLFSTGVSAINQLYQLKMAADMNRVNLKRAQADAMSSQIGAQVSEQVKRGRDYSSAFLDVVDTLKGEGYVGKSYNEWLELIRQAADENNGAASLFLSQYGSQANDYYSRTFSNELLNNITDNDTYVGQRELAIALDSLNIAKLTKECSLYDEQIKSVIQDTFTKYLGNQRGVMEFEVYQSSFADMKTYTVTKWSNMMRAITAKDKNGVLISLDTLMKDQEAANYMINLAALHRGATYRFWTDIANSSDEGMSELWKQVSIFDNPFFGDALDDWCKAAEAESKTAEVTIGVGPYSFDTKVRTGVARSLYKLLHDVNLSEDLDDSLSSGQPGVVNNTHTDESFIPSKARVDSVNESVNRKYPWVQDHFLNP